MPGDGDVGVDADGAGEDRGRDLGGELEECGAAGLVGPDPELVQALGRCVVLIGGQGWAQGKSHGDGARAPMVAYPLRFAATVRASCARGSGS